MPLLSEKSKAVLSAAGFEGGAAAFQHFLNKWADAGAVY